MFSRSQWLLGLRRGSAAAGVLVLRVRIAPVAWMLCVVCCQVEVCAVGRSLVQRTRTECGVSECDREASIIRVPCHLGDVAPWGNKCLHATPFVLISSFLRSCIIFRDLSAYKI